MIAVAIIVGFIFSAAAQLIAYTYASGWLAGILAVGVVWAIHEIYLTKTEDMDV